MLQVVPKKFKLARLVFWDMTVIKQVCPGKEKCRQNLLTSSRSDTMMVDDDDCFAERVKRRRGKVHPEKETLLGNQDDWINFTVFDGYWDECVKGYPNSISTNIKEQPASSNASQKLHAQHGKKKNLMKRSSWAQRLSKAKEMLEHFLFLLSCQAVTDSTVATEPVSPLSFNEPWNGFEDHYPSLRLGQRYSLLSDIGDGSCLSKDVPNVKPLRPNSSHLNVSYFSDKNLRDYMEDRFHISGMNTKKSQNINISLFAVFDGHGGAEASQYCCDWISYYLHYYWTNVDNIGSSFRSSFRSMDVDFRLSGLTCGTTACSCLVVGKKYVVCANLGDSRAIVIQDNGDFVGISRDHRPSIPEETKRITQLGGAVIYTDQWRVQGKLAVSRAIGDYDLKPFVTSDPEITEYQIQKKDRYLVLGSDGVYDVLENTALAKLVMDYASKRNFMHVAQFVCDQARGLGSSDNISLIVVDLCG